MSRTRIWWHLAVGAVCAGLAAYLVAHGATGWSLAVDLIALGGFAATWYALSGRIDLGAPVADPRARADARSGAETRAGAGGGALRVVFVVLVVLTAGLAAAAAPMLAMLQTVAYPALWVAVQGRGQAILASTALAAAVGVGTVVSVGAEQGGLVVGVVTAAGSLTFAIGMGLWISSIADVSESRRTLLAELEAAQTALAAASRDAGAASERERFARDLHDTVAQDLTGLVMGLRRARQLVADGATAQATAIIDDLQTGAEAALAEARAIVASSAPPAIDGGAAAALDRLAARVGREAGLGASASIDPAVGTLQREAEVVLVRVAQEALSNVRRHAGATAVALRLERVDGDEVRLDVVDDGCGFDPESVARGFGLDGMRERLGLVGGRLELASGSTGTRLSAWVPAARSGS